MAFADDVADLIAGEISHIGLGTDATTEVTGGGYTHLVPTYGAASGGVADITSTLEFDGPANTVVTHIFFKRSGSLWVAVEIGGDAASRTFNSPDGRLDVTSAPVSAALAS